MTRHTHRYKDMEIEKHRLNMGHREEHTQSEEVWEDWEAWETWPKYWFDCGLVIAAMAFSSDSSFLLCMSNWSNSLEWCLCCALYKFWTDIESSWLKNGFELCGVDFTSNVSVVSVLDDFVVDDALARVTLGLGVGRFGFRIRYHPRTPFSTVDCHHVFGLFPSRISPSFTDDAKGRGHDFSFSTPLFARVVPPVVPEADMKSLWVPTRSDYTTSNNN